MDRELSKSTKALLKLSYGVGTLFLLSGLFWFMGNQTFLHGKKALLIISSIYAVAFFFAGLFLFKKNKKSLSAKCSFLLSIAMIPVITLTVQVLAGVASSPFFLEKYQFYFWVVEGRFCLQVATLLSSLAILHFIRIPMLTIMVYAPLWLISLDTVSCIVHSATGPVLSKTSMVFGAALIVFSVFVERIQKKSTDFAFWDT